MFHEKRPRMPPIDELFLTDMLDQLTPDNPKACIPALQNKAYYLLDQAKGIIARSARESLIFFEPDHPLCGLGIYAHVRPYVEQQDELVYLFCVELLETINHTPTNLLTLAIAQGSAKLDCGSQPAAATWLFQTRNVLTKLKRTEKVTELRPYYSGLSLALEGTILYVLAPKSLQSLDKFPK